MPTRYGMRFRYSAGGEPCTHNSNGLACRFIRPPRGFSDRQGTFADGVTVVDRLGLLLDVTTVERTVTDLFDRHDLAGGAEELFNSLDLIVRVDADALVRHTRARGNASAAGALGFWLEREREHLAVPDSVLEELHSLAPAALRYALGAKPGTGMTAKAGTSFFRLMLSSAGLRVLNDAAICPDAAASRC